MLHAFLRNKSNAYRRYLGERDCEDNRVSAEDEIASIVFGPLELLPVSEQWLFWKTVLSGHESVVLTGPVPSHFFAPVFAPQSCAMTFWNRQGNIEPDLLMRFGDAAGIQRTIMVELKWNAPLSGQGQLEKQWRDYLPDAHATALHVFLAKTMTELPDKSALWSEPGEPGTSRLRALRWHSLQHEVRKLAILPEASPSLQRWATLVSHFLERIGIHPFAGFRETERLAAAMAPLPKSIPYWNQTGKGDTA